MSSNVKTKFPKPYYGEGYAMSKHAPQTLEGRILTLIEAIGLPERQESSLKSLISQTIWNTIHEYEKAIYLSEKTYGELRERYNKAEKEAQDKNLPMGAI